MGGWLRRPWQQLLLAALSAAVPALASADPLITDRPDVTESTATMAPGSLQLEGGLSVAEVADAHSRELGELLLRIGLTDGLELRLEPGSYRDEDDGPNGRTDGGFGLKARLSAAPDGALPAASLLLSIGLPTGERPLGEEEISPELKLLLGWELAERLALGANLGVARPHEDGERFRQATASVTLGLAVTDRLGAFVETYAALPEGRGGEDRLAVDAGLTLLLSPDVQLDARIGRQLNGDGRETAAGVGFAVRFD